MPCNASYARFIFGMFFTSTIIWYAFLFAQNFYSCKKWVLQFRWLMDPWTFSIKFPYDTQFIFGSLMFTTREDRNLELLIRGPAPRHPTPVFGTTPYYPTDPSISSGPTHVWMLMQGHTISPPWYHKDSRSKKPSSRLQLGHWAPHLQYTSSAKS
jgi:hypothetical protein